jgi:hypothetical protein
MTVRHPFGFVEPCLPSKAEQPSSGSLWVHEIKHDGYRLMVRRDGASCSDRQCAVSKCHRAIFASTLSTRGFR